MVLERSIRSKIEEALTWSPVILLIGPRQSGKTTLVQQISNNHGYTYISFDNLRVLSAAKQDPIGFVQSLVKPVILDEVQRVPELFLPIKEDVDNNRQPGRYILTGSANPLEIKGVGDSLAGRMLIFSLYPLSQGEIAQTAPRNFIDFLFSQGVNKNFQLTLAATNQSKEFLSTVIIQGGFPEVYNASNEKRDAWFDAYLTTRLHKDITDLARIEGLTVLPDLMQLLATRIGSLLNIAELSRSSRIPTSTLQRYLALFNMLFLTEILPPWSTNLAKRLVKTPKIYLIDSGLAAFLNGATTNVHYTHSKLFGLLLENLIVTELIKQLAWSKTKAKLYHFRTSSGVEVDLILEVAGGPIAALEIKSSDTVRPGDFKGLSKLQEITGDSFICGIVLYSGNDIIPFGTKLWAIPVSWLWS